MKLKAIKHTGIFMICFVVFGFQQEKKLPNDAEAVTKNWFPYFDFDIAVFKNPPREFGPFTRWWWPGNNVDNAELQSEIKMFAANGFAGVEIQPLTMGINPKAPQAQLNKVYSWDTPSFYDHVKATMEQAKKSGVIVDMNGGSGWPVGGPLVQPGESMLTLTYSDMVVQGGQTIAINIPKQLPDYTKVVIFDTVHLFNKIDASFAKLQGVIMARVLEKKDGQFFLDESSVTDITQQVKSNLIQYTIPAGQWTIIAFWAIPDGQIPTLIASKDPGFVANHFDSGQIFKTYEHLFGRRSGLQQYYGNPMRAVFNDSYEFRSDRHYSLDFISFFKQQRGYDITPWLGACLQKGYNNNAAAFLYPDAKPPFVFSDEDWRIQYDYDLTVGELLQKHFIQSSNHWLAARGMLHRTQAYGIKTDVIASSGSAAIPEAEQLFAKGSEGFIKLVTSGAHLYNRPVTTQESFVFLGRSEMTTPQKIKTLSDKAFTCGINQIIYSGTSYKYQTGEYGKEGWNTWSSPYSGFDFSSNINESFTYWKDIKPINLYITRSQYGLRSGKPQSDVLIYFPFADFTQEDLSDNPEEILSNGYFKGFEPEENSSRTIHSEGKLQWFDEAWKTINELNARGITWDWVNDASLQIAALKNGNIDIRGNQYKALVLLNAPYIQLASAAKINALTQGGSKLVVVGSAPVKQPCFLNYKQNDLRTKQLIEDALHQVNSTQIHQINLLDSWAAALPQQIKFNSSYKFTRTIERVMKDSSRLKFIWNQTNEWQRISLTVNKDYSAYWLNPETGTIEKNKEETIAYALPPLGSVILYTTRKKIAENLISNITHATDQSTTIMELNSWNISAVTSINNSPLFDWRTNDAFKYQSEAGIYTTTFNINKKNNIKYFLDAGNVYFTADLKVNNKPAGKRLWRPYTFNITGLLQQGTNKIEITVTPTLRNYFIFEAHNGNKNYTQFKGKENALMPAGLVGPVRIITVP